MTEQAVALLPALLAGFVVGVFYFGLMWLTISRIQQSRSPAILLLVSYAGRLAIAVGVFYRVASGDGRRLVAALVGFIIARWLTIAFVRREQPGGVGRSGGERPATDA